MRVYAYVLCIYVCNGHATQTDRQTDTGRTTTDVETQTHRQTDGLTQGLYLRKATPSAPLGAKTVQAPRGAHKKAGPNAPAKWRGLQPPSPAAAAAKDKTKAEEDRGGRDAVAIHEQQSVSFQGNPQ